MKRAMVTAACKVPYSTAEDLAAARAAALDTGIPTAAPVAGYHVAHGGQVLDLEDDVFADLKMKGLVAATTKEITSDVGRFAMETTPEELAALEGE